MPWLLSFMACPPPRSTKRSAKKKKASSSAPGLLRGLLRGLVGKGAIAAYGAVAALASAAYVPQLDQARQWAISSSTQWLQQQAPVQTLQHWLAQIQGTATDWQGRFVEIARQSRGGAADAGAGQAASPSSGAPANSAAQSPRAGNSDKGSQGFSDCAEQLPASAPLSATSVGRSWMPVTLCSTGFAVLYSGLSKTPIVTVERLSRQRLQNAAGLQRTDHFYADARLRAAYKAELSDYQASGYDRGHMAPAADQSSVTGMAQSFALSNMVPQDPTHNRQVWSKLEADVRKYAKRARGNVFVYTGPLFEGQTPTIGRNQVWVPSHLYKLVFDEQQQRAWAWVLPNRADVQLGAPMSYAQFVQRTGRNFLPHLH
ncbi:DNA/RNA non-specific endonuclease [Comamonas piscis]|nr:DNA/RNA non-specific endonuclease [Comamonas piscis]WSO32997.1 DNA/RNA non-specific endonuclease [Comamonas piscis]